MIGAIDVVVSASVGPQRYSDGYTARDTAPARARHDVRLYLLTWGLEHLVDDAQLIVSELVTNAISHTSTSRVGLSVTRHPDRVRIVVTDTSRTVPAPALVPPGTGEESGRGLVLVAALADRWEIERVSTGKRIWCELDAERVQL